MLSTVKGMIQTLSSTWRGLRKPVTKLYPENPTVLQNRFMGFPGLTCDKDIDEPFCTGCMVCIRNCPTQCMTATMKDNPKFADESSKRRKIVDEFEINLNRCILCGICVDVCNFDAIVMTHEHEESGSYRDGSRMKLDGLLEIGGKYQTQSGWKPAPKD